MENMEQCWMCGREDYIENMEEIGIIGPNDGSNIPKLSHFEYCHEECYDSEKYRFGE